MRKSPNDKSITRGIWFLSLGVVTSWIFGIGLVLILAAAICGIVGMVRGRPLGGLMLLGSSMLLGIVASVIALHTSAILAIYAFGDRRPSSHSEATPILVEPTKRSE
jgi:hypothetical protein